MHMRSPLCVLGLGVVAAYCLFFLLRDTTTAEAAQKEDKPAKPLAVVYLGNSNCKPCHTSGPPPGFENLAPLQCRCTEVKEWEGHDKHQNAFAVLKDKRAQEMGKLLNMDVTTDARCLSCHGVAIKDEAVLAASKKAQFTLEEGVSCVVCHGPHREWAVEHGFPAFVPTYRDMTRAAKEATKGMTDLWNPVKRAELCASCHIGSREAKPPKFVTHEMYAAGHPPLPSFEIATFSDQMPRHWEYLDQKHPEVRKRLEYKEHAERSHLLLVGAAVSFRESMRLLANEAAAGDQALDLAHFDCRACHHDLRSPSWRLVRGYVGKPGRPQPRTWPISQLRLLLHYLETNEQKAQADEKVLREKMLRVHAVFDQRPFGEASAVHKELKTHVLPWATQLVQRLEAAPPSKADAQRLTRVLPKLFSDRLLDYDEARQLAWMFQTLHAEAYGPLSGHIKEAMAILEKDLRLSLPAGKERSIEKELDENLKAMSAYDPERFRKLLGQLGEAQGKK